MAPWVAGDVPRSERQRVLLVRGGVRRQQSLELLPAFVVDAHPSGAEPPGRYRISGFAKDGQMLFSRSFEPGEIDSVLENFAYDHADPADEIPETKDGPAVARPGDVFVMGRHRLLLGDARDPKAYERLMQGEVEVYPAAHGWVPPDMEPYDQKESERAWGRLLALFGKALA